MCYGPEFVAKAVREWIVAVGAKTAFIEPVCTAVRKPSSGAPAFVPARAA